ncbi:hypothetical protein V5D56_01990 [Cellulosimicrobium sp. PMB13]|uniref:hypothetical protein n=1 Tax=Cellulosimicrobium sp. PMB13 TaxID=3120158 RepID=UPI003F4C96A0
MPTAADLAAAVGQRLERTPYRIADPRPDGFTMRLDLADARWWGVLSRSGLRETHELVVRVTPDGRSYATTDRRMEVGWTAGPSGPVPHVGATLRASGFQGKTWTYSAKKVVGVSDAGRVETVVDYAFSTALGHRLVSEAAASLGLREKMSTSTKIGVVAAVIGGAMALVAVVGAVVSTVFMG